MDVTFNFESFSLWDQLRLNEMQAEMYEIQTVAAAVATLAAENPTAQLPTEYIPKLKQMGAIQREQMEMIARCLRGVPSDWLVPNAPKTVPWGELEALRYVRGERQHAIQQAFMAEMQKSFLAAASTTQSI